MIDDIVTRIGWTLVHTVWQGAAAAAGLALVLPAGHRLSANARYLLSCGALILIVVSAVGTFIALGADQAPEATLNDSPIALTTPLDVDDIAEPQAATPLERRGRDDLDRVMPWVVRVWIVGVALLGVWQFGGWVLLRRLRRGARAADASSAARFEKLKAMMNTRRVVLAVTDRIDVPVVIGAFRPLVLAPLAMLNNMSIPQVEAILAHELAHVKRYDYLVNLIQTAVETLLFYHPAVWWISRQIRREREICCDEQAARVCGDRVLYARALSELEASRGVRLAPAAAGHGKSELLVRVRRLLGANRAAGATSRCWAVSAGLIIACAVLMVPRGWLDAQATAPATPQSADPKPVPSPIGPDDFVVTDQPYLLEPNDLVQISITRETQVLRISRDGTISLPLIGLRKISGLSQEQAVQTIDAAYKDANLAADGPVKLVIAEQRGRTFSIFGAVGMPGQFSIPTNDFKLLDALTVGGGAAKRAKVQIFRGQRMIVISPDQLEARDPKVNIIIRPKDFVFVETPDNQPFRIVVQRDRIETDGKGTTWEEVRKVLEAIPAIDRRSKFIELSAGSGDLPVRRFFQAKSEAAKLVSDLGLAHVSEVGVEPGAPEVSAPGEYYIGGLVKRTGVYSMTARGISLRQAILAAGGPEQGAELILVVRRTGEREQSVREIPVKDLLDGKYPDMVVQRGDQLLVRERPTTGPADAPAPE
jgi:beta-lactamase regulating signal transducer with metallopeptidase domain/protein involved in polysaccharide export with SLBB domain